MIRGILYKDETGQLDFETCVKKAIQAHERRLGYKPTHLQIKAGSDRLSADRRQAMTNDDWGCWLILSGGPVQEHQYYVGVEYDGTREGEEAAVAAAKKPDKTIGPSFRERLLADPVLSEFAEAVDNEFLELAKNITKKKRGKRNDSRHPVQR